MTKYRNPLLRLYALSFAIGAATVTFIAVLTQLSTAPPEWQFEAAVTLNLLSLFVAIGAPYFRYKGFARNYGWKVGVLTLSAFSNLMGAHLGNKVIPELLSWYARLPAGFDPHLRYCRPCIALLMLVSVVWLDQKMGDRFTVSPDPHPH